MVKTKSTLVHFIHFENHAFQFIPKVEFSEIHRVFSGSGCGSVGRAVSPNTRDPQVELSHQQILFAINCIKICNLKDDNRDNGPFK